MPSERLLVQKLERLEKDVEEIKARMADADSIMTEDDYLALLEYRKEKSSGKLLSHENVKRELGL